MTEQDQSFFANTADRSKWAIGVGGDASSDELHPQYRQTNPHYALTETQYFSFHVPDANISGLLYMWHHPNLGTVSAGPMVFKGVKRDVLRCELLDFRGWMTDRGLSQDMSSLAFDNGYRVDKLDPNGTFRAQYRDDSRKNMIDVTLTPCSERIFWPGGKHFEQVMKTSGTLMLRGEHHDIDGFSIRDRSWGEARMETPASMAPPAWITGTFGEDFAFHITATDDPALDPMWKDRFEVDRDHILKFGWAIVDGSPVAITDARKITRYDKESLFPTRAEITFRDEREREFRVIGTVTAVSPLPTWHNVRVLICLVRWECEGRVAFGEIQEVQWTDFMQDW